MYALISELNKEKVTIIMISHDIGTAVNYADHILHVGDNVFFGTRDEYLGSKAGKFFLMMQSRDSEHPVMYKPRKTMTNMEDKDNG